jgi:hypothetical protein
MITLTPDEVTLIKSVLTALRGIKVRDIDRALLVLSKRDIPNGEASDRTLPPDE